MQAAAAVQEQLLLRVLTDVLYSLQVHVKVLLAVEIFPGLLVAAAFVRSVFRKLRSSSQARRSCPL
jgi:hypothetical protein